MSLAQLLNTPAKIIRRSASGDEDAYGNDVPAIEEIDVLCEVQKQVRRASEEPDTQGELSDTAWVGFFPSGTELSTGDAIRVEGLGTLELVGDPWDVRSPRTQTVHHVEAPLRQTMSSEDAP